MSAAKHTPGPSLIGSDAYKQGVQAYFDGKDRSANPHSFPSNERLAWLFGFNDEKQADEAS